MTRAKICGITREADLTAAVDAGADALGFTAAVTVDTPREVSIERAAELVDTVPPFVTSVLVTMPDTVDRAVELAEVVGPDAVQIHATLTPDGIGALGKSIRSNVIAAVDAEETNVSAYAEAADALLVDSIDEQGGGGTGETHDWERTRERVADLDVPVVLAGGLTPENVEQAVETVQPFAVDVASGVEPEDAGGVDSDSDSDGDEGGDEAGERGVKDTKAVQQFIERAKRARESA